MPAPVNLISRHQKTPGHATVLLPPGLGDIHWVLLKLQGFLNAHGFNGADVWIWDVGGPRRSAEFVKRVPFVRFIDYLVVPDRRAVSAFCTQLNPVMANTWGFDFVIALNGYLEAGLPLEPAMDNAAIHWDYPILTTPAECEFARSHTARGPWILLYFSGLAQVFKRWTDLVTPKRVADLIDELQYAWPDRRVIFVGLPWDHGFAEQVSGVAAENLVGQTSFDEYVALLRGADGMIGFANGNTILTTHFGVPTVMVWNQDRYTYANFRLNWVAPQSLYAPVEIDNFDPESLVSKLRSLMNRRVTHHDAAP